MPVLMVQLDILLGYDQTNKKMLSSQDRNRMLSTTLVLQICQCPALVYSSCSDRSFMQVYHIVRCDGGSFKEIL